MIPTLTRHHARRLRELYRSSGWPVGDALEVDLLAAGLVERQMSPSGAETLRVTDRGIDHLARSLAVNRRVHDAHEAIVARVVEHLRNAGRITYTSSAFRVKPGERWKIVRPDVYSIRRTFAFERCEPHVHEVKASRADLMNDLRNHDKRNGYAQLASRLVYVLADNIAAPDELPAPCGVWFAMPDGRLVEARPATPQPLTLSPMHALQLLMHRGPDHEDAEPAQHPL